MGKKEQVPARAVFECSEDSLYQYPCVGEVCPYSFFEREIIGTPFEARGTVTGFQVT